MKGSIRSKGHAEKVLEEQYEKLEKYETRKTKAENIISEVKSNINYLKSFIGNSKQSKKVDEE